MENTEKIFFSYNRKDSEFALKLAADLTNNGLNIWIDQLNITPGARWDAEIEHSLELCSTQLVILSQTSVDSQNVLDEVSFAIDAGKRIIPIVLENCHIPLRLKRFQYIDFSSNYDQGVKNLLAVLKGINIQANSPVAPKPTAKNTTKPSGIAKYKKALVIGLISLVAIIIIGISVNSGTSTSELAPQIDSSSIENTEPSAKGYKASQINIVYTSVNDWHAKYTFLGNEVWEESNSDDTSELIQTFMDDRFIWLTKSGTTDTTIIDIDRDEISLYRGNRPDPTVCHIDSVILSD